MLEIGTNVEVWIGDLALQSETYGIAYWGEIVGIDRDQGRYDIRNFDPALEGEVHEGVPAGIVSPGKRPN